jgi:dTDP-4-dehydrorhamnose 3,5-epimerase
MLHSYCNIHTEILMGKKFETKIEVKKLKVISDERGWLMEILRCDDNIFRKFGQVYLTTCRPGVVKGWHLHNFQTDHMTVVCGKARIVTNENGHFSEFVISKKTPMLIKIPPKTWHAIQCIGSDVAYVINCPDIPYNRKTPDEHRLPLDYFKEYKWKKPQR